MELDLNQLEFTSLANHKKKNKVKSLSAEDVFSLSHMPATSRSSLINNEFYLAVRTQYKGCICCTDLPLVRIPVHIEPAIMPGAYGFQIPDDFKPIVAPLVEAKVNI